MDTHTISAKRDEDFMIKEMAARDAKVEKDIQSKRD